jgi:hypothetical protein
MQTAYNKLSRRFLTMLKFICYSLCVRHCVVLQAEYVLEAFNPSSSPH